MDKWSLFIDIEGFSNMYRTGEKVRALELLSGLMLDLYKIGTRIYSNELERLFIYQVGDGFIIAPDYREQSIKRALSIALALMRATVWRNGSARAAISHGGMEDVLGYYPQEIRDNVDNAYIRLPAGVMSVITIFQVMGDALVNAYKLSSLKPEGPRLLMDLEYESQLEEIGVSILDRYSNHLGIDWIHSEVDLSNDLLENIGLGTLSTQSIESLLREYVSRYEAAVPKNWKESAENLIRGTMT